LGLPTGSDTAEDAFAAAVIRDIIDDKLDN